MQGERSSEFLMGDLVRRRRYRYLGCQARSLEQPRLCVRRRIYEVRQRENPEPEPTPEPTPTPEPEPEPPPEPT